MTSQVTSPLLVADPKDVDKFMADELNALSFRHREALSEEMHGVRSLAPDETPEMIRKALHDLNLEIEERLCNVLASLPSQPKSNGPYYNGSKTHPSTLSRREYLGELLAASKIHTLSYSQDEKCLGQQTAAFQNGKGSTTRDSHSNGHVASNGNDTNCSRYSHVLSDGFRVKFLRAELLDVKKAATRYIKCIDFLMAYFGQVALQRPLYITDLDRDDQKLLREGQCQFLPSRDRFGRRIIVFLGSFGSGYTHMNRFKVVTYMIFQAAADDVTTQRNGLVAIFSTNPEYKTAGFYQMAFHQNESIKFFEAVPLRYSAFHFILPSEMEFLKGFILNMIGKRMRLVTRIHTVSGVTETSYMLRCFGIETEDYPITSSGTLKNKKHLKWIKFRTALEEAHERGVKLSSIRTLPLALQNQTQQQSSDAFVGIECPEIHSVIFRNGGSAYERPANLKFREIVAKAELEREQQKTIQEKNAFLDGTIADLFSNGLTFLLYDDKNDWYVELQEGPLLRKKVFQAIRDQSARRKRLNKGRGEHQSRRQRQRSMDESIAGPTTHQINESSTSIFMELDNVKRRKVDDMTNFWI